MQSKVMRDVLIEQIFHRMHDDERIMFLSADFGSPALDQLREKFKDRFINVGIAEQNLINISTGLALEGYTVYAYAIAAFITMRAYEQIRTNLSLLSQTKPVNVNLVGVGAGISYNLSGPSHHCLEDITIMRLFPNFLVISPSDWILVENFVDYTLAVRKPKYIRLEGKAVAPIYTAKRNLSIENGFYELMEGENVCLVSTGYITHKALKVAKKLLKDNIHVGVVDIFLLSNPNEGLLSETLKKYDHIITIEEAFINRGGLDSLIANILIDRNSGNKNISLERLGFNNKHVYELGSREYLYKLNGLDEENIIKSIKKRLNRK